MVKPVKLFQFGPITKAKFIERPNRFVLIAETDDKRRTRVYLPNPGRLRELLLPGVMVYLVPNRGAKTTTKYIAVAVERDGKPVFLHTHLTNSVARHLIETGRVPGLDGYKILRAEVPFGRSRFDFLLERNGEPLYLEIKSCTLFGNGTAMFPDAVTARGRRHVEELAEMSRTGTGVMVLFIVHSPDLDWFMPDYHTDPAFSRALIKARHHVPIVPLSIGWNKRLELLPEIRPLEIPWDHVERESEDRGAYLLLMRMERTARMDVGKLGELTFEKGWYIYIGSAMKNLTARIKRHMRKRKKSHWHIDYLARQVSEMTSLPIRTSRDIECELARDMSEVFALSHKRFGSSDCRCASHLLYSDKNPLHHRRFHAVLEKYRMRKPRT